MKRCSKQPQDTDNVCSLLVFVDSRVVRVSLKDQPDFVERFNSRIGQNKVKALADLIPRLHRLRVHESKSNWRNHVNFWGEKYLKSFSRQFDLSEGEFLRIHPYSVSSREIDSRNPESSSKKRHSSIGCSRICSSRAISSWLRSRRTSW